jgi:hypothetical protein
VAREQPESTETLGEAFDRWLIEAPVAELEDFIAEAAQLLSSKPLKPLEFLRDCKARVDARLAAEPETKVFSMSHRIRCWEEIAERFEAEINWRTAQAKARKIDREGAGRRGDPFRCRFSFPCSPYIPGTMEQETEKGHDTRINTGDILVPDIMAETQVSDDSREQAFWEGKL